MKKIFFRQSNEKYIETNNFKIIDAFFTKILIYSLLLLFVSNLVFFMTKDSMSTKNFWLINNINFDLKFISEVGVFEKRKINIKVDSERPILNEDLAYMETVYFEKKNDLGYLINKSIEIINSSKYSVNNEFIQVEIKNYITKKNIATVIFNKNESEKIDVYIN